MSDFDELVKATEAYTMAGIADCITCPTFVLEAENDQFFTGQPQRLLDELTCEKKLIFYREDESAASTATRVRCSCSTSAPSTGSTPYSPADLVSERRRPGRHSECRSRQDPGGGGFRSTEASR
ncbi:hypothetical protein ACWGDS_47395 [Streptomyces sp. NPDC055059]